MGKAFKKSKCINLKKKNHKSTKANKVNLCELWSLIDLIVSNDHFPLLIHFVVGDALEKQSVWLLRAICVLPSSSFWRFGLKKLKVFKIIFLNQIKIICYMCACFVKMYVCFCRENRRFNRKRVNLFER